MSEPEITTESKERLEVLELDRVPRAEKLARETQLLEGASEVHFTERAFRPRHRMTIDEIRAAVDKLPASRVQAALPQPLPPPPPAPAPHVPRVRDTHRAALAPLLLEGDVIVRVESVYKTDAGEVVDATIEHHGKPHVGTFLIEEGVARKMADVHHAVDALPAPTRAASPAPNAPAPAPEKKSDAKKPSRFKLPFSKKKE